MAVAEGDEPAVASLRKTLYLLGEADINGQAVNAIVDKGDNSETIANLSPEDKQEIAVLLAREGNYAQALLIFERDLKAKSSSASNYILGDYIAVLSWAGHYAQVINVYEQHYIANPEKLSVFMQRIVADAYYNQGEYAKAGDIYQLAAKENDQAAIIGWQKTQLRLGKDFAIDDLHITTWSTYAVELARVNQFDESIAIFEKLIKKDEVPKETYYDFIAVLSWAGKNEQAFELYDKYLSDQPEKMPVFTQRTMGNVFLSRGKYEQAKEFYLMAAAQGDREARISAAEVDARAGKLADSMKTFDELVAGDSANPDVYVQRANAYVRAGAYISASKDYDKALTLINPTDNEKRREIIATRAALFISASEFAEARDLLQPYIKNNTATALMQSDYIVSLQGTGEYTRAIETGEALWPDKTTVPPYGLRALGDCYLRMRKYNKAIEYHEIVIKQNTPEKQSSMLSYAYALAASNNIKKAKQAYSDVIKEFPLTKGIVSGDAKGLFERGRFHAGKAVFRTLADSNPTYGPYRQQLAFDLYINEMPREAYVEYKRLAEETPSKEAGYAGMAQSAIQYGDYAAAERALKNLEAHDTGSKEATEAKKAWVNRWRGSYSIGYEVFDNYQNKTYQNASQDLEVDLGSSWRFLAANGYQHNKEENDSASYTNLDLGLGYVARKFDIRVWGVSNFGGISKSGYRVLTNYYFNDFSWLTYSEARGSVENPLGISEGIMRTERDITFNRRVGKKDLYTVGYLWDKYSDHNRNNGWHTRFGHMSLDTERKEIEWYVFANRYGWDREVDAYDSPTTRMGYGPGLRMRWIKPRVSYWELITELGAGYDYPDRKDFTPFMRLERGWNLSAGSLLVVGTEFGGRTDRSNYSKNMNFGYRQFDIRFYRTW